MKQRSRSDARQSPTRPDSTYLKFLKPGALAQLRNSRLSSSRSPRLLPSSLPSSPPFPSPPPPPSSAGALLSPLSCGPRFPQRKKLVASKVAMFLRPPSPVTDSPDPIISTDVVVAAH